MFVPACTRAADSWKQHFAPHDVHRCAPSGSPPSIPSPTEAVALCSLAGICINAQGQRVAESYCGRCDAGPGPVITLAPLPTPPPTPAIYFCRNVPGACSVTCGVGTAPTLQECVTASGETVADSFCESCGMKDTQAPPRTETCTKPACPAPALFFCRNVPGPCSVTCGVGTAPTLQECVTASGETVADSFCESCGIDVTKAPPKFETCTKLACTASALGAVSALAPFPTPAPATAAVYFCRNVPGPCSVTCGVGAAPILTECVSASGDVVADSFCDWCGKDTPKLEACTKPACTSPGIYECRFAGTATTVQRPVDASLTTSATRRVLECSVTCGQGVTTNAAQCINLVSNAIVDNVFCGNECTAAAPCTMPTCPTKVETQWIPGMAWRRWPDRFPEWQPPRPI